MSSREATPDERWVSHITEWYLGPIGEDPSSITARRGLGYTTADSQLRPTGDVTEERRVATEPRLEATPKIQAQLRFADRYVSRSGKDTKMPAFGQDNKAWGIGEPTRPWPRTRRAGSRMRMQMRMQPCYRLHEISRHDIKCMTRYQSTWMLGTIGRNMACMAC